MFLKINLVRYPKNLDSNNNKQRCSDLKTFLIINMHIPAKAQQQRAIRREFSVHLHFLKISP